jgi:hypothetical protein
MISGSVSISGNIKHKINRMMHVYIKAAKLMVQMRLLRQVGATSWNPEYDIHWARTIGSNRGEMAEKCIQVDRGGDFSVGSLLGDCSVKAAAAFNCEH